ncbi:MAG: hypothetical protein HBSAPP01_13010 [Candidatus Brocadia sapporoensis]|nr:MAG: hypothetical protein HBSAPP01_13010 [Candidatus Brocadia sapporoensis]
MSFEQEYYENNDLWQCTSCDDINRTKFIATKIPFDVRSVLDVGCGNGFFLNYLQEFHNQFTRLCGIDRSESALKYVKTEKKLGSIDSLPFSENEFDLLVCLEVLEHLPLRIYKLGLKELCRVSNKYIVITVPYNEELKNKLTQCPSCYTKFNANYHLRSFNREILSNLLRNYGFRCVNIYCFGRTFSYIGISKLIQIFPAKNNFPQTALCPVCGYTNKDSLILSNQETHVTSSKLRSFLKRVLPKRVNHRWYMACFEKM